MSDNTWSAKLADQIPPELAREIEVFEQQMQLRQQGKLDDKIFAETRLRRGVYGQRYDNGQRHDGKQVRNLEYPSGDASKGAATLWDAPGMQRIKIPFGGLRPDQLDVLADLADEYSDSILHVTTRQDFQLHFIHIEDTPDLMRRLAAVGITTREACGNSVRNVTACPIAGVCRDELFDVTPYAKALSRFLLGHADCQDFGRKFKVAFSGCAEQACGLVLLHDLGYVAATRVANGRQERGFRMYVGGGLGAVPHQAKLFDEFLPESELLSIAQAVTRVFARLGEKKNRNRARIKFLVAKLGIDEFRQLVLDERKTMPPDPRWTEYLQDISEGQETPPRTTLVGNGTRRAEGFDAWAQTNVYSQRQAGYAVVTVMLPLGDLSSPQARVLSDIARQFCDGYMRTTVEQNVILRWVREADLPRLHQQLAANGLAEPGAGTVVDVTACPGTDTCKLGIASSRGLASELRKRLAGRSASLDEAIKNLRIKISGCFNSCGQHHVADIGFYGNSRKIGGYGVPHFQVVLGGQWQENAGAYGMAIGSVPSKRIPDVVDRITGWYVDDRKSGETFQSFVSRLGKKVARELIDEYMKVPVHDEDPSFYTDWADAREFTIGDMGIGECAGEVVSSIEFGLADAEREAFEAQVAFDAKDYRKADGQAYQAMLDTAAALIKLQWQDVPNDTDVIVGEFRRRFYDTELFFDKYARGKFAQYLFARHARQETELDADAVRRLIEEAQLFIEAVHACETRMAVAKAEAARSS